jgi:hypothetical protein
MNPSEQHHPSEIINTSERRLNLHFTLEELNEVLDRPDYNPEELIQLLKRDFHQEYESQVGVIQELTLEQHTLKAAQQFEKYFADQKLPGNISLKLFRFLLALHDIGKPEAFTRGDKRLQHVYTPIIVRSLLENLGFQEKDVPIAVALVSIDPIGEFLKNSDPEDVIKELEVAAEDSGVPILDLYKLLLILYQVDASSYTKDAGVEKGMDRFFIFDSAHGKIDFSPPYKNYIEQFTDLVQQISGASK